MDMKRHMYLFYFFNPCWWIGKKSEIVIRKGGR